MEITKIPPGRKKPRRTPEEMAEAKARSEARRGVVMTSRERAQHEAELAALRALDKHAIAERARTVGMKRRQVRAHDGSVQEVWSYSSSYHAMGFEDHQIYAAERFSRDWEAAYRGLRGQGFDPGVDGGKSIHGAHHAQVAAQARLDSCREYLGLRSFAIVVGVVIHGATVSGMMAAAKRDHRAIRADMDVAFNDMDAFYSGSRMKDRTWQAFEIFNAERAALIERAEREVG